jgi:hypothetical protein
MKKQLAGVLAASAVTLASGAALSDSTTTLPNAAIVEFQSSTHELFVTFNNLVNVFLDEPGTVRLPSVFGPGSHPPDPCFGLALTWDGVVFADNVTKTENVPAFEVLLGLMSDFQCTVQIQSDGTSSTNPVPISSIGPVLQ